MIKSAVIGCGVVSVCHLDAVKASDMAELVAVCDIIEERAKATAKEYGCAYYTDYKEMISSEKLDCVHICLPHWLHAPVAVYCLENNVNVVLEKPIASSIEGGEAIVEAAKKSSANIAVCFQNRYNNVSLTLKKLIDDGKLGKLKGARGAVTWSKPRSYYLDSDWRGKWATEGGGVLINQSIHTLDLMQWLMGGKVESVKGHASTDYHDYVEVEDTASINLTFEGGVHGIFYATTSYCENSPIFLEISGEKGIAEINGGNLTVRYADGTVEVANNDSTSPNGKDYWGNAHASIISDFYKNLENGPFWISPEEAMKTLRILKEVYRQSGLDQ